jgi:hypothetical protein
MGREIKFRAKVMNSKNWIYRQPFHIRGTWYMYSSLWEMVPIEHKTIGQYTGLKDKNGKEIYEGDILETDLSFPYVVVVFRNGAFMYQCHDSGEDFYDYMAPAAKEAKMDHFLEVIGNIYENPELLENN